MKSIYNIQEEYLELLNEIEENDGELTEELEEQLAVNIDNFEDKMRNYTYLVKQLQGDSVMIDDEIARLKTLKDTKTNLVGRLKNTMRDALQLYRDTGKSGNKTLDLGDIKFHTRKNELLRFDDEDKFMAFNRDYVNVSLNTKFSREQYESIKKYIAEHIYDGNLPENFDFKYHIDKRLLKQELKNKVEIDGVSLYRDDSLIIK